MSKIRVGIVRGGTGFASEYSIKSGGAILRSIREKLNSRYEPVDILIDKEGYWHIGGRQVDLNILLSRIDVILNALHDDDSGAVAEIARTLNIPYVGSSAFGSSFSSDKYLTKEKLKSLGVKTAPGELVLLSDSPSREEAGRAAREIFLKMPPPWVVKPNHGACSLHVEIARSLPELELALFNQSVKHKMALLVESYIYGREVHTGLVEGLRGEKHYHSMPVEILKNEMILSSAVREKGEYVGLKTRLKESEKEEISKIASIVHSDLGLSYFSGFDFVVNPKGVYLIEVNDVPEFHEESTFSKGLSQSGVGLHELVEHLIKNAQRLK